MPRIITIILLVFGFFGGLYFIVFNVISKIYDYIYAKRRVGRIDDREVKDIHSLDDLWKVIDKYHIPLDKIRFFIGEDYKEPKAFGIYKDETSGDWIVYKNKANGERAIRYQGKDEDYAVNEIWSKLVSEAQNRGMGYLVGENDYVPSPNKAKGLFKIQEGNPRYVRKREQIATIGTIALIWLLLVSISIVHIRKNGYYMDGDDLYYRQGYRWYYYDSDNDYGDHGWDSYDGDTSGFEKIDSSDIEYDYERFESTDAYESYHESRSDSDSDWDSWDSSDTDWDSDW